MRNVLRSPLVWMVAAEIAVVGALIVVGWNVVAAATHPSIPSIPSIPPAVAQAADPTADPPSDLSLLPQLNTEPKRGPRPGLAVDPAFWRDRLDTLNSDQVFLEQLEWQVVRSALVAANDYVQTVVLPSIRRAEHAGAFPVA